MSVCLPPLWAKADCVAIQYERSGHSQLVMSLETKPDKSISVHAESFLHITLHVFSIGRESCGPICIPSKKASLAGGVGSCNHQHRRDEVFGVEETVVACKPLRPLLPCLPSQDLHCTKALHPLTCAVRCVVHFSTLIALPRPMKMFPQGIAVRSVRSTKELVRAVVHGPSPHGEQSRSVLCRKVILLLGECL